MIPQYIEHCSFAGAGGCGSAQNLMTNPRAQKGSLSTDALEEKVRGETRRGESARVGRGQRPL